jgi:hypothetical protein
VGVRLDSKPMAPVTVPVTALNPSRADVSPASLLFDTNNWDVQQYFVIRSFLNFIDDGDAPCNVVLGPSESTDYWFDLVSGSLSVLCLNDDHASIGIQNGSLAASYVRRVDGFWLPLNGSGEMQVLLTSEPLADVQVQLWSSDPLRVSVNPTMLVRDVTDATTRGLTTRTVLQRRTLERVPARQHFVLCAHSVPAGVALHLHVFTKRRLAVPDRCCTNSAHHVL